MGRIFTYDGENKQVKVEQMPQQEELWAYTVARYFYDGDGKRVKKEVPGTGEITIFVYDAMGKQIAEYSTNVATIQDAKVAYLTNDHLGSPRINTDRDGNVTSRHDYHPFGEEIITNERTNHSDYTPDGVRQQFTGYERDGETELDFAQARMYSSGLGRFLVPDEPFLDQWRSNPQSWNLYSYVRNNPLRLTDPSGTCAEGDDPSYFEMFRNWLIYGYGVSDEEIKKMAQERRETLKGMRLAYEDQDGEVRLVDLDSMSDFQVFKLARHVANLQESGEFKRFSEDQLAGAAAQDPIIPPVGITQGPRTPTKAQSGTHNQSTPKSNAERFEPVRGQPAKRDKETGEIWVLDRLHKNHYEVYKNKRDYERGRRSRSVWDDGRPKENF